MEGFGVRQGSFGVRIVFWGCAGGWGGALVGPCAPVRESVCHGP